MPTSKKSVKPVAKRIKRAARMQVTDDNRRELVVAMPPMKVPKFLEGFLDFVRTQGVVGLAVGLVLGVAAKSVVDSLVANIFNPIIGLVGGGSGSLESHYTCLKTVNAICTNKLGYGKVISDVLSFLIVAAVVYMVVHGLRLDKLDKAKAK